MVERDRYAAAVEIMHLAGSHVDGPDRQPRLFGGDALEIDKIAKGLAEAVDRVKRGALDTDQRVESQRDGAVRGKITRNAAEQRHQVRGGVAGQITERQIAP